MALERKPLFNPRLVQARLEGFDIPPPLDAKTAVVARWRATLDRGRLEKTKETQLQGLFLVDFFQTVLGYASLSEGRDAWTYAREETVQVDGKCADGVLGYFTDEQKTYLAAIELKAADTDLDARPAGRRWTAVEQCYQYAINLECDWIIVSNYREIRLYHKTRSQQHYERFQLETLTDPEELKRFCFLLGAEQVIARKGASVIDRLLEETGEEEEKITRRLYAEYKQTRLDIFDALRRDNPQHDERLLLEKAQKILDRVLFVCFCEDRGLLPAHIIDRAYEQQNPFAPVPVWRNFVGLFHAVDQGSPPLNIPGYNGGLFATDEMLDHLVVSDEVCERFRRLARYDYAAEVNVDILGHIFEQSISDIENLKAELAGERVDRKKSKRKREGVYYTPEQITRYIVEEAVGGYLKRRFAELEARHAPDKIPASHKRRRAAAEIALWTDYRDVLRSVRVLDPACGSGAFLIQVFDYLAGEYERCNARLARLRGGQREIFDLNNLILSNNLYGVDINPEAVEITKLSLWIKTARAGKPLTYLDDNIQCGNSLIDDPAVDSRAFRWEERFPDVFAAGGFDVVVGNPPYVKLQNFRRAHPEAAAFLVERYESAKTGNFDMFLPFIERGLSLLKPGGRLGFIAPSLWLRNEYGKGLRDLLRKTRQLDRFVDFKGHQVFEDVTTYTALQFFSAESRDAIEHADAADGQLENLQWSRTPYEELGDAAWILLPESERALIQKLHDRCVTLEDATEQIFQGLITSADAIYHLRRLGPARYYSKALDREVEIEDDIMRPLVSGQEAGRYARPFTETYLLFPYDISGETPRLWSADEMAARFPKAWDYLRRNESALRGREHGKFDTDDGWWQFGRNQNIDKQERPKLGVGETVKRLAVFCDDKGEFYFNNVRVNGILVGPGSPFDIWFLLGVLNAPPADFVFRRIAKPKHSGYFEANKQFIAPLPIPDASPAEQAPVADLARRLTQLYTRREEIRRRVAARILTDFAPPDFGDKKLPKALQAWRTLDFSRFRSEIKKRFKQDIPVADRDDWQAYLDDHREKMERLDADITQAERELNAIVYRLYDLTPDEIAVLESAIDPEPTTPTRRAASRV